MGRNAAGESFLRGFLSHSKSPQFWVQVQHSDHVKYFSETVELYGDSKPVHWVEKKNLQALTQPGVVYYPGPGIGEHAWHRSAYGHDRWSLCGITHTTSSAGAMDALVSLITTPVQPWDAVICTSNAVKDNVNRLLQAQVDYLKNRLGITRLVLPQLPVIPLGIHCDDFVFSEADRSSARNTIEADSETLVVLFMGRLSFHAKAHPLAMYQALELAAKRTGKKVVLVECGWHANDFIAKAYADAAKMSCPSVRVVTLDGRNSDDRKTAWASADVFCSLSDNIQETFGIVPIEAMAAGIPVVVSDWDGYKDTVRDQVDGFRIPTLMPTAGSAGDLAFRHALDIDTYDMYCGHTCSLIAVDVDTTADAFTQLFSSRELRQKMGAAGQERARSVFDWSVIIPQYEALWAELDAIRMAQGKLLKPTPHEWPARMDPFYAFAAYPTQTLIPDTILSLVDNDFDVAMHRAQSYRKLAMVDFAREVIPSVAEIDLVLRALSKGQSSAASLLSDIPQQRQPFVFRGLVWLAKIGIIKVSQ